MFKRVLLAAVMVALTSTGASAVTFNRLFVESNGHRPMASGDISGYHDLGLFAAGEAVGIGGRIVGGVDIWQFTAQTPFRLFLTDLPIDDNEGFDHSSLGRPYANNGQTTATFSLTEGTNTLFSTTLTSTSADGLLAGFDFEGGPGTYRLLIDGQRGRGATYDLALVAPVPIPATLPLLLGGLGAMAALYRRKARA